MRKWKVCLESDRKDGKGRFASYFVEAFLLKCVGMFVRLGIRATMTIELEGHGFCLPATQIQSVGNEQWVAWPQVFFSTKPGQLSCGRLGDPGTPKAPPMGLRENPNPVISRVFFGPKAASLCFVDRGWSKSLGAFSPDAWGRTFCGLGPFCPRPWHFLCWPFSLH